VDAEGQDRGVAAAGHDATSGTFDEELGAEGSGGDGPVRLFDDFQRDRLAPDRVEAEAAAGGEEGWSVTFSSTRSPPKVTTPSPSPIGPARDLAGPAALPSASSTEGADVFLDNPKRTTVKGRP
jgi:hypothetical protein